MANLMKCWHLLSHCTSQILIRRPYAFRRIYLLKGNHKVLVPSTVSFVRFYAKGSGKRSKNVKAKIQLSDEELNDVIDVNGYRSDLQVLVDKMKSDFVEHLVIRTAAGSIENLTVNIDREEYPLVELAQISRKNPSLIALNMALYPEAIKPAIKAINDSGQGLNPQQDGTMIYLPIPKVTRELREKLSKNAKVLFGKTKEQIRDTQNKFTRDAKGKTSLSEDLIYSGQLKIAQIAEEYNAEAEKLLKIKQTELLGDA